MKHADPLNDENQIDSNHSLWWVFTIGALLGVLLSAVISQANRIRASFGHVQSQNKHVLDDETSYSGMSDSQVASSPSAGHQGHRTGSAPAVPDNSPRLSLSSSTSNQVGVAPNMAPAPTSNRWSAPTRYIMGVFLFMAVLVVLYIGRSAIPMVAAAALLAVFVDPLIDFLVQRLRMKNGLAVSITYLLVVALILLIPLLAIPSLVSAVNFVMDIDSHLIAQQLNQVIDSLSSTLQDVPAIAAIAQPALDSLSVAVNNYAATAQPGVPVRDMTVAEITSRIGTVLGAAARFLGPTFSAIASVFITLLISLQMTLTAKEMQNWYADLIPPGYGPEFAMIIEKIRRTWVGFLRGQMSLMLIIGVTTWLGGTILGLPQALLLGIIAGVLELIPNVGPTLAAIPAVALALLFGSTHLAVSNLVFALIVVAFYVAVQLVENQFFVPRIMGDAVDLPPLVVLIGTIAGAGAFGILGALIATPVIATGNLIFRYVYRKIMQDSLAPAPVEEEQISFVNRAKGYLSRLRRSVTRKK